eukprot:g80103.t1
MPHYSTCRNRRWGPSTVESQKCVVETENDGVRMSQTGVRSKFREANTGNPQGSIKACIAMQHFANWGIFR